MSVLGQKENLYIVFKLSHPLYYKTAIHINFLAISFSSFSFFVSFKISPVNTLHTFTGHKDTVKALLLSVAE